MSSQISQITDRFDSKEYKMMVKCGSKDAGMKEIFEKIDIGVKQIKVCVKNFNSKKNATENLKNMFVIMMDLFKLTGTKEYQSYMIKNCPDQVVAARVAESKRMLKTMNETFTKLKNLK